MKFAEEILVLININYNFFVLQAEATKLSGLKKSAYQVALKTLESVLELNTKTNMRDLAIRFGCLQVLDAAARLLSR